jgi:ppGpp synthetase/RelA/SpoT-type nucleotidyltranferase
MEEELIQETVSRYIREYDRYKKLTDIVFDICQNFLYKNLTIRATVQHRTKSPSSLAEKLRKSASYHSAKEVFDTINDLSGVRIVTYQEIDIPKVVGTIRNIFSGKNGDKVQIDIKNKNGQDGRYYKATHCYVTLPPEYLADHFNLKNTLCEIQVCSLLSHVYNEIEHDLQYKLRTGDLSEEEKKLIDQLGLITKSGDVIIHKLLRATNERLRLHQGEFVNVQDFAIRMGELFQVGELFSNNAGLLYEELLAFGLNSPEAITLSLIDKSEDMVHVATKEYERLTEFITSKNSNISLNEKSSDLLLMAFLRKHVALLLKNHQYAQSTEQSSRIFKIAQLYNAMLSEHNNQ